MQSVWLALNEIAEKANSRKSFCAGLEQALTQHDAPNSLEALILSSMEKRHGTDRKEQGLPLV